MDIDWLVAFPTSSTRPPTAMVKVHYDGLEAQVTVCYRRTQSEVGDSSTVTGAVRSSISFCSKSRLRLVGHVREQDVKYIYNS